MALSKTLVIDKIEVLEDGTVQVRRATYIMENGERIAGPIYHRTAYSPGDDVSNEDPKVIAHCKLAWTPEVIASYKLRRDQ